MRGSRPLTYSASSGSSTTSSLFLRALIAITSLNLRCIVTIVEPPLGRVFSTKSPWCGRPLAYSFFDLIYNCRNVSDLPRLLLDAIRDSGRIMTSIEIRLGHARKAPNHGECMISSDAERLGADKYRQYRKVIVKEIEAGKDREVAALLPV